MAADLMNKDEIELGNNLRKSLDEYVLDELLSVSSSHGEWVVVPSKPLPEDGQIRELIQSFQQAFLDNMTIPLCAKCFIEVDLNDAGDIYCSNCGMIIEVKNNE
jgi:DNA-directed RNA polymerase subunit RPC12/RpoP